MPLRLVDDTAYNATTWDGVTGIAPSKNAVRDRFEAITGLVTVTDEAADNSCFPLFATAATGTLIGVKSNSGLTFNAVTGMLGATGVTSQTITTTSTGSVLNDLSVSGARLFIKDYNDATKVLQFETSSISPAATRTLTVPDASGTIVIGGGTCSGASSGTNTGDQTITLTGPITGSGTGTFATSVASQTGTGTTFVMNTSPTLITPVLGVASATSLACATYTSAAAMTFTPTAGNNFNVVCSGAGDFAVNANLIYADSSTGNVGVGTTSPDSKLTVAGSTHLVGTGQIQIDVGATPTSGFFGNYGVPGGNEFGISRPGVQMLTFNVLTGNTYFPSGNVGIGISTFGTSAATVLAIANGTEPSTSPADIVQLYSVDLSAGNATLGLRTETAVVTESVTSDRTLSVRINGTTYRILLKS